MSCFPESNSKEGEPEEVEVDPARLPSIQYTREELLVLEKTDLALLRPDYLALAYDRYKCSQGSSKRLCLNPPPL